MGGITANTIRVSGMLIVHRITNEAMILIPVIKSSSGQW